MRKSTLIAFAFTAVFASNSLFGQTSNSYPWRNQPGVPPVVQSTGQQNRSVQAPARTVPIVQPNQGIRVASLPSVPPGLGMTGIGITTSPAPAPPKMKRRPFLVSFRGKQQAEQNSQPSVSDVGQYSLNAPSVPGGNVSALQIPGISGEPPLSIQSNASTDDAPNYCDRDCKKPCCLGSERKLFGSSCRGLEIGGWTSLGYHNRNNNVINSSRKAEANLNQAWLYFDKAASQDCMDWSIGYRADLLYGIDAQNIQAFGNAPTGAPAGWDNSWDYGSYGWALPQAYVQFANALWDVKVGKFNSPFGYEVVAAPGNFFYSHTYTMNYSEPFTMSGVLGERRVSDTRSVLIGATAGWDTGFENNNGGNLITGQRFQPNEYVDIALTSSIGDTGSRGSGVMSSAVAQMQLTGDLKYVFQADVLNIEDNQEFGIVQYMFRDVSECLALGARLEWWKSDQFFPDTKSTYDFTVGANYRPTANITIRPELRWDWGAFAVDPGTTIIAVDAVMTF